MQRPVTPAACVRPALRLAKPVRFMYIRATKFVYYLSSRVFFCVMHGSCSACLQSSVYADIMLSPDSTYTFRIVLVHTSTRVCRYLEHVCNAKQS